MFFRLFILIIFLDVLRVSAGEYFIKLTQQGIQAKQSLLSPSQPGNNLGRPKKSSDKIMFNPPVLSKHYAGQFNSWLKVSINSPQETTLLDSLGNAGLIDYYEPVGVFHIDQALSDSLLTDQWYLEKIQAIPAWKIIEQNAEIIVGVIDTGIDYKHPDLQGGLWKNEAELHGTDGVDDDDNGFVDDSVGWDFTDAPRFADGGDYIDPDNDPMDEFGAGHGTQIAGIISAQPDNGIGIAGVAPGLRVMNLRAGTASGYLEEDDVANALLYALDNGARVVNMSFGDVALSRFLRDIIYFAYQKGMIIVASSGNSGNDEIHYPSGLSETISVGASNQDDNIAGFSNYGSTLDCVAPGVDIISTAVGGGYNSVSGTSFSAPMVSAIAGQILTMHPEYKPERVRNILKTSSDDILYFGWDNYSGAGRVSALNAVSVPDGGILKLIQPEPNSSTALNDIVLIGSALHPDIKHVLVEFGTGQEPQSWQTISEFADRQFLADTLGLLNLSPVQDSIITIKLAMILANGTRDELHSILKIDRSPPVITDISVIPMYDGAAVSQLIEFKTDDITSAKIYISANFNNSPVEVRELGYETNFQRIKLNESEFSGSYRFYIEAENQSGLVSIDNNDGAYYTFTNNNDFMWNEFVELPWKLPSGYLLDKPVDLDHDGKPEAVISRYDENQAFGPIEVYEFENDQFVKRLETSFKAIPRDAGDVDKDGLSDLLLGYGKYSYLLESDSENDYPVNIVWSDTLDFWAAGYADLDDDGKNEIIGRNDSSYIIKEYISDNSFQNIGSLPNTTTGANRLSIPKFELIDVTGDNKPELVYGDQDGDLIIYTSMSDNTFQQLPSAAVRNFDATSLLSAIDTEFGARFFAASHTSDDLSYEHEFDARYWTIEQFIPEQGTKQLFKDNEINIYGYQNLREFDSGLIVRPFYDKILLFASLYPDIYIFNVTADKIQPVWQRNDARSNAILIGDFDDNGVDEFYYNDGSYIRGFTLPVQNRPDRPGLISANPLDSIRALISWSPVSGVNGYRVYRGADRFDLQPLRITGNTGVIDSSLNVEQKYYFAVSAIDSSFEVYESLKSSVDSVRTSLPPRLISAGAVNDRQAVLTFNEDIKISDEKKFSAYLVPSGHFNTSAVVLNDRKTILAGFSGHFNETVMDTVVVSNIFDTQGVPVDKSFDRIMLNYTVQYPEPYIQSRKVLDRKTIELTFSEPMLRGDLLNTENFRFYPAGEAEAIQLVDSVNTLIHVQVSENSRIGALGFETYLILQNMHSEKGVLLNESKKIYLNEEISDLHNTIIYPQPVKPQHNLLTFAGLPENVSIYIFDMNGRLVKTIKESTYYGGIQWDLKDENDRPVHSGVYLYRIVHSGEEKLGKLVIVR